jgi:hypothetical protein
VTNGTLLSELMSQPLPLQVWLMWLGAMNLILPLAFMRNLEARIILGLAHVIFWTPLLPWLTTRLESIAARSRAFLVYAFALLVTDGISLGIDLVDVFVAGNALLSRAAA